MTGLFDGLSWVFLISGAFFTLTGALGLLRLPDVFTRMHAAGMTDTMGAGLILVGLCFQTGDVFVVFRLVLILALLWFTSPIATHALAKAALHGEMDPDLAGFPEPARGGEPSKP